jgi:phosphoribosylformylglycinamidine (FGAM) synthase-like enzyme
VHDCSDGGLAVAIAEMAMASGIGAALTAPAGLARHAFWFGEDQARYVVTVPANDADRILSDAKLAGIPALKLGLTGGNALKLDGEDPFPAGRLRELNEAWLPKLMGAA